MFQISYCSHIAYNCSQDTACFYRVQHLAELIDSNIIIRAARRRQMFGVVSGCGQWQYLWTTETAGQASPKKWRRLWEQSCRVQDGWRFPLCSPAYISQSWCNMAKENRLTIDIAMLQNSTLNMNFVRVWCDICSWTGIGSVFFLSRAIEHVVLWPFDHTLSSYSFTESELCGGGMELHIWEFRNAGTRWNTKEIKCAQ